jgi:glutathione S-transferase
VASLTLYHGWRSSASRRVRLCLAEKGLAFESRVIDLTKMEHHSPGFLKLNPNGVIPLLILEDGRSLYESGTICEFADETWPDPPLRPDDAYGRAVMRNWIRHVDGLIGNLIVFNRARRSAPKRATSSRRRCSTAWRRRWPDQAGSPAIAIRSPTSARCHSSSASIEAFTGA